MFLIAGIITMLWSILVLFFMPPDPIRAKGFTDRERYIAVARMRINNAGVRNTHFKFDQVIDALTDIRFWLIFFSVFLSMVANGPVSTFVPIIIHGFGFDTLTSLLLIMPAGFIVGAMMLGMPYIAYRIPGLRTYLIISCSVPTVVACCILWLLPTDNKGALLFATFILASFGAGYSVTMGLQLANTAGYTKRSVTSSGIFVGYCLGNFTGPLVFKEEDAPSYGPGFAVVLATTIASMVLMLIYRIVCIRENKRRDKTGIMEGYEHAYEDDFTDRKVINLYTFPFSNIIYQALKTVNIFAESPIPLHNITLQWVCRPSK